MVVAFCFLYIEYSPPFRSTLSVFAADWALRAISKAFHFNLMMTIDVWRRINYCCRRIFNCDAAGNAASLIHLSVVCYPRGRQPSFSMCCLEAVHILEISKTGCNNLCRQTCEATVTMTMMENRSFERGSMSTNRWDWRRLRSTFWRPMF